VLLTQVQITDFLSIKGTLSIDFDRKVTILLGSNDHGKSNILRALEHLNADVAITEDEMNWDAEGMPSLQFTFSLTKAEKEEWRSVVVSCLSKQEEELRKLEEDKGEEDGEEEGENPEEDEEDVEEEDESAVSIAKPPVIWTPAVRPPSVSSAKKEPPSLPESKSSEVSPLSYVLDLTATTITLGRTGIGTALDFQNLDIAKLPKELKDFINSKKPRVEIFRALAGNLQDSASATTITTPEYEFLQGVFFYAGLDPRDCSYIFNQDDKTQRVLDIASKKLDGSLRELWGQGTELHFELRHRGTAIEFLADDPAIKKRKARMSKRSSGVTQFFRVSMVLHARRMKHSANSYIYLFDEPGVLLHPQGQRDLLQVFEQLADQNQIVYATHSLFLLNQNFPERHRLIFKDEEGTKVDQKPYRQNWKLATDALGVYLTSNILFSNKILLVEGDSDPMYLYELFRQLNKTGDMDVDLNALGIMSFYDYQNLRFLVQVFKRDSQNTSVVVMTDGDSEGKAIIQRVQNLCKTLNVPTIRLQEGRSIEDLCLYEDLFVQAVTKTLENACEAEEKAGPKDLGERVRQLWEEHKSSREKPERRTKADKDDKEEKKEKKTAGRWFKEVSAQLIEDEASKVVLARTYSELCRQTPDAAPSRERLRDSKALCSDISAKLSLPAVRAVTAIEISK
jgi:predicted ATP-dependent endonuclease of OLD family